MTRTDIFNNENEARAFAEKMNSSDWGWFAKDANGEVFLWYVCYE